MGLSEDFSEYSTRLIIHWIIISYKYCLAELQALVNKTFGFARGIDEFDSSRLTVDEFTAAYLNLDIIPDEYDDLLGFTARAVARND